MDMEIIDTVSADTLEVGDTIEFFDDTDESQEYYGLREIKSITDNGDSILLVSEDDEEMSLPPVWLVDLYGYAED